MGVAKLWDILKECKQDITLHDMKGKTLAVDLAIWICESEGVKSMQGYITKPYLRNLFFRVKKILSAGIKLLFVIDGNAPELKLDTIARRLGTGKNLSRTRSRLNARLKECCILLDSLGIPWIKAEGEAEALCASLNKYGLVEGVITNDGDSFLYGARTVYRNFSVDNKEPIERYDAEEIERHLNLNQRNLIALGLLLGCDYCPKGVPGIGGVQAMKLLSSFRGRDPLGVFESWRRDGGSGKAQDALKKPTHCSTCGHLGLKRDHSKEGCNLCGRRCPSATTASDKDALLKMHCVCEWHLEDGRRKETANEDKVKSLALKDGEFPNQEIIQEFSRMQMYGNQSVSDLPANSEFRRRLVCKPPTLDLACKYLSQTLEWTTVYTVKNVLPLLTSFKLKSSLHQKHSEQIIIHSVVKTKKKDHIPSYEVKWSFTDRVDLDIDSDYEPLTIEATDDVERAYPAAVQQFKDRVEEERQAKKKEKQEAQKLERRKKREDEQAEKKGDAKPAKKMTDFYKARKPRQNAAQSKKESKSKPVVKSVQEAIVESLGVDLAALSLCSYQAESSGVTEKGRSYGEDVTKLVQPKGSKLESTCDINSTPIIIFSSDSECETEVENRVGTVQIPEVVETASGDSGQDFDGCKLPNKFSQPENNTFEPSTLPQTNDITFSHELNFSLDFSMAHTPIVRGLDTHTKRDRNDEAKIKPSPNLDGCSSGKVKESPPMYPSIRTPLGKLEMNVNFDVETPEKAVHSVDAAVSDSPIYMTLIERIKARNGGNTKS